MDAEARNAFRALTATVGSEGFSPFRWQERLYDRLQQGDLPDAVDVPTGLGKTAVMVLWLIARAQGADLPRRLVYVVDRRVVVDQATREAERLRRNLPGLPQALAVRVRSGLDQSPLAVSTLRGQFADNGDWLADPSAMAIVVGTVDMVGSRLLFEGYGVSRRMRPYHAGLLGVDTLVVLDEAHLCLPFEALLRSVARHRDGVLGPRRADPFRPPSFRVMSLSATGRDNSKSPSSVFRLDDQDVGPRDPLVRRRLTAEKRLRLVELTDRKELVVRLATRAVELGTAEAPARVIVYCHSRKDALGVKAQIDKRIKPHRAKRGGPAVPMARSELMVGERRQFERELLERWLYENGFLASENTMLVASAFLVATSAGEVGVDLDADHLVCDLVAHERMVQRLGRVNRRGGDDRVAIVDVFSVVVGLSQAASASLERIQMAQRVLETLPVGDDGRRNVSPQALTCLKREHPDLVAAATTAPPLYPDLTRPVLDSWCLTSLKEHPGRPEVGPWIRGWEENEEPSVELVWRMHLPTGPDSAHQAPGSRPAAERSLMNAFFRSAPVHASERLEVPCSRAVDWFFKRLKVFTERCGISSTNRRRPLVVALDRSSEFANSWTAEELRARVEKANGRKKWAAQLTGLVLVVDARFGGLESGMLEEKSAGGVDAADGAEGTWQGIGFRVVKASPAADGERLDMPPPPVDPGEWRHSATFVTAEDEGGRPRCGLAIYVESSAMVSQDARSILAAPQGLSEHGQQVGASAGALATRLGLPQVQVTALRRAGELHDVGKAAHRWQDAMNAPRDGRPYAKTTGGGDWRLLDGYRHEFGSLLEAERDGLPEETRDLVLHLVAAHHGYARPLISHRGCDEAPPSVLEAKAGEIARRFVRLQRRYGPWGLAWREAIVRAADFRASREWDRAHRRNLGDG